MLLNYALEVAGDRNSDERGDGMDVGPELIFLFLQGALGGQKGCQGNNEVSKSFLLEDYNPKSCSPMDGCIFACASTATDACCKMLSRTSLLLSSAMSASVIRAAAAEKFSAATCKTFVATSILA